MYQHIDANRQRSWILILLFIGVLSAAGYAYGYLTDTGYAGLAFALIISIGMTSLSWFWGDKLILWTAGAHEISQRNENLAIWNLVENLCIAAGLPKPRIYIIDDPSPNAFATGRDPAHATIALTTGLINLLNRQELEGVIAHELSHVKNLDSRVMLLAAVLVGAITLLGDLFIRGSLFGGRRDRDRDDRGGLQGIGVILGIIFLVLSPLIAKLIQLAISRRREYLADASGALLTRYPEGLASALEKIRQTNLPVSHVSQATAHLWVANPYGETPQTFGAKIASWFSTHPPIDDRIKQLRAMTDNA